MKKIRVAVVGYGNIGKYSVDALKETVDMELAGVVRRESSCKNIPTELENILIVNNIQDLGKVDVALLCCPTRSVPEIANQYLKLGVNTVDSFDIHGDALWNLRKLLDETAKKFKTVSILSAGWDPGSDSIIRVLMEAIEPKGITYTNFGPGMSMGHTVAVKSKDGVKNALSMTIPVGMSKHDRIVYVELEPGFDFATVEKDIKTDAYFTKDKTTIKQVDDVNALINTEHGVLIEHKFNTDLVKEPVMEYKMRINNPQLTAQIMLACGRATMCQQPGAYTMPEIPVMDMLQGDRESLVKRLI
jgi:diaminopimelate dehydrogenase